MLCFAAIVPHTPQIIPTINRDSLAKTHKTIDSLKSLSKSLSEIRPESLIMISSHGPALPDAFSLNLSQKYSGDFKTFGDLTTKLEFNGDLELNYKIKERFETTFSDIPLTMITEPKLDYSFSVPLYYLIGKYKEFSLIPLCSCALDYQKHLDFGQKLKEELVLNNKKIGLVVSANFCYCSEEQAPKTVSSGKKFDQKLIKLIREKQTDQILSLDQKSVKKFGETGLSPVLILLGILKDLNYKTEVLSYENPFGTGQAVINFDINPNISN